MHRQSLRLDSSRRVEVFRDRLRGALPMCPSHIILTHFVSILILSCFHSCVFPSARSAFAHSHPPVLPLKASEVTPRFPLDEKQWIPRKPRSSDDHNDLLWSVQVHRPARPSVHFRGAYHRTAGDCEGISQRSCSCARPYCLGGTGRHPPTLKGFIPSQPVLYDVVLWR